MASIKFLFISLFLDRIWRGNNMNECEWFLFPYQYEGKTFPDKIGGTIKHITLPIDFPWENYFVD
jgi:hypothetical protein